MKELLTGTEGQDDSTATRLLVDIWTLFGSMGTDTDRISSAELVKELTADETGPWAEYGRLRKPLSQRQLAELLSPFDITPKTIRVGERTPKGYLKESFLDAWSRYLPSPVSAS